MLSITRNNVLVRIDKAAQKQKRNKIGSIIIPEAYQYMIYNLQYGEIMDIGSKALKYFPELEVGDTALVHHAIEDGGSHLLDILPNGDELRWVNGINDMEVRNFQIFGIVKPNGIVIPSPVFIFLDKMVRPAKKNIQSTLAAVDQEMWKEPERIRMLIEDIKQQEEWMAETFHHVRDRQFVSDEELRSFEEAEKAIISMRKERAMLTRALNNRSMYTAGVLHIHEQTAHRLGVFPGDRIMADKRAMYPLDVQEDQYLLIASDQLWGKVS